MSSLSLHSEVTVEVGDKRKCLRHRELNVNPQDLCLYNTPDSGIEFRYFPCTIESKNEDGTFNVLWEDGDLFQRRNHPKAHFKPLEWNLWHELRTKSCLSANATGSVFNKYELTTIPAHWNCVRRRLYMILHRGDSFVGLVVLLNFVFIVLEVDTKARGEELPVWLFISNQSFIAFYTVEIVARLYVQRKLFAKNAFNIFDLVIVGSALLGLLFQDTFESLNCISIMRAFRLIKMLRVIRAFHIFKELWDLVRDMIACLRTLSWTFVLSSLFLSLWSVFAVEFLHDSSKELPCDHCATAFSSVLHANLTLFGLVAFGHGWADLVLPLFEQNPWTILLFLGVVFTMMVGLLNIVIAAMCENAANSRTKTLEEKAEEKEMEKREQQEKLHRICQELDADCDGAITFQDLVHSIETVPEFKNLMCTMDMGKHDLDCLFHVLDEDHSGDISHQEFADQLWKMRSGERTSMISTTKYYVQEISRRSKKISRRQARQLEYISRQNEKQLEEISKQNQSLLNAVEKRISRSETDIQQFLQRISLQVHHLSTSSTTSKTDLMHPSPSQTPADAQYPRQDGYTAMIFNGHSHPCGEDLTQASERQTSAIAVELTDQEVTTSHGNSHPSFPIISRSRSQIATHDAKDQDVMNTSTQASPSTDATSCACVSKPSSLPQEEVVVSRPIAKATGMPVAEGLCRRGAEEKRITSNTVERL